MNTSGNVNSQTLQESRRDNFVGIFWNFLRKSTFCCIRKVLSSSSDSYRLDCSFKNSADWDLATLSGLQRDFPCPQPRRRNWKQTLSQLFVFGVRFLQEALRNSLCCFARDDLWHMFVHPWEWQRWKPLLTSAAWPSGAERSCHRAQRMTFEVYFEVTPMDRLSRQGQYPGLVSKGIMFVFK